MCCDTGEPQTNSYPHNEDPDLRKWFDDIHPLEELPERTARLRQVDNSSRRPKSTSGEHNVGRAAQMTSKTPG
jgi:hypothetical protein